MGHAVRVDEVGAVVVDVADKLVSGVERLASELLCGLALAEGCDGDSAGSCALEASAVCDAHAPVEGFATVAFGAGDSLGVVRCGHGETLPDVPTERNPVSTNKMDYLTSAQSMRRTFTCPISLLYSTRPSGVCETMPSRIRAMNGRSLTSWRTRVLNDGA